MPSRGKRASWAILLAATVVGCGASEREATPPGMPIAAGAAREGRPRAEPDERSPPRSGEKWRGWRWRGDRDRCTYVVDSECMPTKLAACRATGCGVATCREAPGTAPIKVSCAP